MIARRAHEVKAVRMNRGCGWTSRLIAEAQMRIDG